MIVTCEGDTVHVGTRFRKSVVIFFPQAASQLADSSIHPTAEGNEPSVTVSSSEFLFSPHPRRNKNQMNDRESIGQEGWGPCETVNQRNNWGRKGARPSTISLHDFYEANVYEFPVNIL